MTHIRTVGLAVVVAVILIGVIVRIGAGRASMSGASRLDVPQASIPVAKPEGMKQFPAELVPMP